MSDKVMVDGRWRRKPKLLPTFAERLDESRASYLYKEWKKTEADFLEALSGTKCQVGMTHEEYKKKALQTWMAADKALVKENKRLQSLKPPQSVDTAMLFDGTKIIITPQGEYDG